MDLDAINRWPKALKCVRATSFITQMLCAVVHEKFKDYKHLDSNDYSLQRYIGVRARKPAFGLIGIRMVIMVYGCKRGRE
jgi:hypothetical protein